MIVEAGKVGIRVAVNMDVLGGFHDYPFCLSTFKVTPNTLEGSDMSLGGFKGIARALMYCKSNIWAGVTRQVE
jgi:hypothetical protein